MALSGNKFPSGTQAFWGAKAGEDFACDLVEDRVLVQHPDATGERQFRDWLCQFAKLLGHYNDVLTFVKNAFRLETAEGDQLDKIGSLVGLPRSGFTDTRYRVLLSIQIELLLSSKPNQPNWTGTVNNLLRICRKFIGDSVPEPVVLLQAPPYAYSLTVPGIATIAELNILVRFLCQATFAGVLGQIIFNLDGKVYCYLVEADTPDAGIYCYLVEADTPGSAVYDHVVVIGPDPC